MTKRIEINFVRISEQEENKRAKRIQDILIKALTKEKVNLDVINNKQKEENHERKKQ